MKTILLLYLEQEFEESLVFTNPLDKLLFISSGWLRMNCMMVFHFLAHELRDEPIFDTPNVAPAAGNGAIYNDFDFNPTSLMHNDNVEFFSFSQPHPSAAAAVVQDSGNEVSALTEALDHAIMEADRHEGILYEDLQWETPLFDNSSENCDVEYVQKVVELASNNQGCWDKLQISEKAVTMFKRRARLSWEGPDTVYDAWLIRKGYERPWFDYHLMNCSFPSFDPDAEQEPPTQPEPQRPQLPTVSPPEEGLDLSTAEQTEEKNPPSTPHIAEQTEEKNPPSTPTENREEDSFEEITSYQPPREETNSPSRSDRAEEYSSEDITSHQPPKRDQTSDNDANRTVNTPPSIPPPRVEQPDRISETSISDLSDQDTTPSVKTTSSQPATVPRRRLSLKRCCNAATSTVVTSGSETEPTKRARSKSDSSIEFDIDKALPEGIEVVNISSEVTSSDEY